MRYLELVADIKAQQGHVSWQEIYITSRFITVDYQGERFDFSTGRKALYRIVGQRAYRAYDLAHLVPQIHSRLHSVLELKTKALVYRVTRLELHSGRVTYDVLTPDQRKQAGGSHTSPPEVWAKQIKTHTPTRTFDL